jgi:hypothetical protein
LRIEFFWLLEPIAPTAEAFFRIAWLGVQGMLTAPTSRLSLTHCHPSGEIGAPTVRFLPPTRAPASVLDKIVEARAPQVPSMTKR